LQDGEKAEKSLNTVLERSTALNLFGLHPPFQMDANFGTTAGIAEMLMQSHAGVLHLLPALPKSWATGHTKGLKARGNFIVDMKWENGSLKEATVKAVRGGDLKIRYKDQIKNYSFKKGESKSLNF